MRNIIATSVVASVLFGCASLQTYVSPARVEAVTALGTFIGGRDAVRNGHRLEIERAVAGLVSLRDAGSSDLVAVAAALQAADLDILSSPEGTLVLGLIVSFQDLWSNSGQVVLDGSYGVAVRTGAIRGLSMALAESYNTMRGPVGGSLEYQWLLSEAKATRGLKK